MLTLQQGGKKYRTIFITAGPQNQLSKRLLECWGNGLLINHQTYEHILLIMLFEGNEY